MVRAILDGEKTVTRRIVKFPKGWNPRWTGYVADGAVLYGSNNIPAVKSPYKRGEILYVRETWYYEHHMEDLTEGKPDLQSGRYSHRYIFKADSPDYPVNVGVGKQGWRPSIHMPKEAARVFLRVTDVRVKRLRKITDEEAKAEGANYRDGKNVGWEEKMRRTAVDRFAEIWDSTIKPKDRDKYGWAANPWVWVIKFDCITRDEVLADKMDLKKSNKN